MSKPYKAFLVFVHADVEVLALPTTHTSGQGPLMHLDIKSGGSRVHVNLRAEDEAVRLRDALSAAIDHVTGGRSIVKD